MIVQPEYDAYAVRDIEYEYHTEEVLVEQPIINLQPIKEVPVPVEIHDTEYIGIPVEVPVPVEVTKTQIVEIEKEVPVFIEPV